MSYDESIYALRKEELLKRKQPQLRDLADRLGFTLVAEPQTRSHTQRRSFLAAAAARASKYSELSATALLNMSLSSLSMRSDPNGLAIETSVMKPDRQGVRG